MTDTEAVKPAVDTKPKTRPPGFTNPAFRAMGIPPIRLPSRNWMIFWTVLTVSVSGVAYDKYQQKQIRNKWCDLVEPLSREPLPTSRTPRKITVFIAPPPNDYLDTSMIVWRRFIKPVLYSSGTDYEVFTESRQGLIRFEVAERIRELRRELLEHEQKLQTLAQEAKLWNRFKSQVSRASGWINRGKSDEDIDVEREKILAKKYKADFDYKQLLGVFYKTNGKDTQSISEDALVVDPKLAGGVICLGRGAYKEYIAGIHEGILGPLNPPETPKNEEKPQIPESPDNTSSVVSDTNALPIPEASDPDQISAKQESEQSASSVSPPDDEDDAEKSKPIPKPYLAPEAFPTAEIPSELTGSDVIRNPKTHVPALFEQPILAVPIPHLIGFVNIPERIYRFYNRRHQAESYCRAAVSCVLQTVRPFDLKSDLDLAKSEESDWPKKWVEQGLEKKSEWVQEPQGNERILRKLKVFDSSKINVDNLNLNSVPKSATGK